MDHLRVLWHPASHIYGLWASAQPRLQVEAAVRGAVEAEGGEVQAMWGGTLYHPDDLPFK